MTHILYGFISRRTFFFDDANKKDLKYKKWEKIEFNINERGFE